MSPSFADDDDGSDRPGPNGVDKFSINPHSKGEKHGHCLEGNVKVVMLSAQTCSITR